jgi:GntR family transcriptional regulator/MocR family aminotransferase
VPDLRLLPTAALARAYRRALLGNARLLDYSDPRGDEELRRAIAEMLSSVRGVAAPPEAIMITRGSQQGLYLVGRALLQPGDTVAVEAIGYPPAWEALRQGGARLAAVPVDREGLDVDALAALAARETVRAVYVTPHHQYPTTVSMSPARRLRLLELAQRHRMMVLEDDYDHEFHYAGRPLLPLASMDKHGVVIYLGTLSKLLAPGLRIGYVAAPPPVLRALAAHRAIIDHHGDQVVERALALMLEDGEVQRHARRAVKIYRMRRDLVCEALRRSVPALQFEPPAGGLAVWARAPRVDVDAWVTRARDAGVAVQSSSPFVFEGRAPGCLRIGFAACNERELAEAVRRLARAMPPRGKG